MTHSIPSYIPYTVIGAIIFLVITAFLSPAGNKFRYRRIKYLFTPTEKNFYFSLVKAVNTQFVVFGKVRIADVLTPDMKKSKKWWRAFVKISSKHLDYVLCHPADLSVFCVIELDDRSHQRQDRRKRDVFVNKACEDAGLPLLRFTAKRNYDVKKIQEKINVTKKSGQVGR